ncbi:hypothetical protein [Methanopyrus kandleri]|uniref:hypothetical protein n=1 Tax=Methanopyrus kandleri TaxID=2320 RepID=UPI000A770ECD|nr:hypothetical protein [Methanopyrus kandleri]
MIVFREPAEPIYWRAKWLLAAVKCYRENKECRDYIHKEIGIHKDVKVSQNDIETKILVEAFIKTDENIKQGDINTILVALLNQSLELMAKYIAERLMWLIGIWKKGKEGYYVILNPNDAKKVRRCVYKSHNVIDILDHLKKTLKDIDGIAEKLCDEEYSNNCRLSELADEISKFIKKYCNILEKMEDAYYDKYSDNIEKGELWYSKNDVDKAIEVVEKFDRSIVSLAIDVSAHIPGILTDMKWILSEIRKAGCVPENEIKKKALDKRKVNEKELQEIINFAVENSWIERKDGELKWMKNQI